MGIWAWIKSKFSGISDEAICEFASVVTGEAYDDTRRVIRSGCQAGRQGGVFQ